MSKFGRDWARPHVIFGRARGVSSASRIPMVCVTCCCGSADRVAGVSITLALSASIPVEALADSPGIGHLAWKAALGRDLPVLVTITLLLTAITTLVNLCSDIVLLRFGDKTG